MTFPSACPSSNWLHDIEGSFEVARDDGEVDLAGGFSDPAPSHPAQAVASFPSSEDLLDPPRHPVDKLVPIFELLNRLGFITVHMPVATMRWTSPLRKWLPR